VTPGGATPLTPTPTRVVVIGPVYCDLVFGDLARLPDWGEEVFAERFAVAPGGSAITAIALARLGHRVSLAATVGHDALGDVVRHGLAAEGVDLSWVALRAPGTTPVTAALTAAHDRAFATYLGAGGDAVDVAAVLAGSDAEHVHVAGFPTALAQPTLAARAHEHGATVSFDPGWDERALTLPAVRTLVREADVVLPNRLEAARLLGAPDDVTSADLVTRLATLRPRGISVVKAGGDGAWGAVTGGAVADGAVLHAQAPNVMALDPTGAGDVFDAGFLDAWWEGVTLEHCLARGCWFGARATTAYGGASAAPTRMEWEARA